MDTRDVILAIVLPLVLVLAITTLVIVLVSKILKRLRRRAVTAAEPSSSPPPHQQGVAAAASSSSPPARWTQLTELCRQGVAAHANIDSRYSFIRVIYTGEGTALWLGLSKQAPEPGGAAPTRVTCMTLDWNTVKPDEVVYLERHLTAMSLIPVHKSLARMLEVFQEEDKMHLVLEEHMDGLLSSRMQHIMEEDENFGRVVLHDIAEAIQILHSVGYIHRDTNPRNFVLYGEELHVKVVSFRYLLLPGESFGERGVGDKEYLAPEAFDGRHGPEADLWSMGVIFFQMLHGGAHPFPSGVNTWDGQREATLRGASYLQQHTISDGRDAASLVLGLLQPDVKKRLTASQVLEHPWVNGTGD